MFSVQLINAGYNSKNKDLADDRKKVVEHALCKSKEMDPAIVLFTEIGTGGLAKNVNRKRGRSGWGEYALPWKFEMFSRNDEAAVMVNKEKIRHAEKIDLSSKRFVKIRQAVYKNKAHIDSTPHLRSSCALIILPCSEHSPGKTTIWDRFWNSISKFAVFCEQCQPVLTIAIHMPNNKKGVDEKRTGGMILPKDKLDNLVGYLEYFLQVLGQVMKDKRLQQLSLLIGVDAQITKEQFSVDMPQELRNILNICDGDLGIDFFLYSKDLSMDNVRRFGKPVGCENVTGHDPVYGELSVNRLADASGPEPGPSHPMPDEVQVQVQDENVADPGTSHPMPAEVQVQVQDENVTDPGTSHPMPEEVPVQIQFENDENLRPKTKANKKRGCRCKKKNENGQLCSHGSCNCKDNGGCTEKCACKGGTHCFKANVVAEE